MDLGGRWELKRRGDAEAIDAQVPGCVHTALHRAGRIDDPVRSADDDAFRWIEEAAWRYERRFDVDATLLEHERVVLEFDGIDTVADVRLNGKALGRADNMFVAHRWDAKGLLKPRGNRLEVRFEPVADTVKAHKANDDGSAYDKLKRSLVYDRPWLRKMQCNFGWDWGPRRLTYGLWRGVRLVGFDTARLDHLRISQRHERGRVTLGVAAHAELAASARKRLTAEAELALDGEVVAQADAALARGGGELEMTVNRPRLWWPNGMGAQPLYELVVRLRDASGALLDETRRQVGLRRVEVVREPDADGKGESFGFAVNGRRFFAKGANWIPPHLFPSEVDGEDYRQLLEEAAGAHMNMIRVWGGGIYEDDAFYRACDRLGLLVWQDFMFACARYPSFDRDWMRSVKVEAQQQVRRLHHHACIAIWAGNNECENPRGVDTRWAFRVSRFGKCVMSWSDYRKLFDKLLADAVAGAAPDATYWPASPHTPTDDLEKRKHSGDADRGDAHVWGPWFSNQTIEDALHSRHRFVSEAGFQALPHPRTFEPLIPPTQRNLTSPALEARQKCDDGHAVIAMQLARYFRQPRDWRSTVYLTQVLQALVMEEQVAHWRRQMRRTRGVLYWQLNDCWPGVTWASLDYDRRPKALHYRAGHFFAPTMVSGVVTERGDVEAHVANDEAGSVAGRLRWTLYHVGGQVLDAGEASRRVAGDRAKRVATLPWGKLVEQHGRDQVIGLLEWEAEGVAASSQVVRWVRPRALRLQDPALRVKAQRRNAALQVTVAAQRPALWVWLDGADRDARPSDNFMHVLPGRPVTVRLDASGRAAELVTMSLWDSAG